MPSVLVLGARGMVGVGLIPALLAAGVTVHARSRASAVSPAWRDLRRLHWNEPVSAVDAVLGLGPLHLTRNALGALEGVPRVLSLSTLSTPALARSRIAAHRQAAAAIEAEEQQLRDVHQAIILRVASVYGSTADRTVAPLLRFARRRGFLPCPTGALGTRQPLHRDDLCGALLAWVRGEVSTVAGTYALGGAERLSVPDWFERCAQQAGVPTRGVPAALWRSLRWLADRAPRGAALAEKLHRFDWHIDTREHVPWPIGAMSMRGFTPRLDEALP